MSTYVKSLDSNHLVCYGGIGFKVFNLGAAQNSWLNNGAKVRELRSISGWALVLSLCPDLFILLTVD